jgi:hypothetical protein
MARRQLRTKDYPDDARKRLGELVEQARRGAGFRYRTDFCRAHGIKNLRGLELLESGQPGVGQASLFEVARALPGWTEDTPRLVLEGGDPPPISESPSSAVPGPVASRTVTDDDLELGVLLARHTSLSPEEIQRVIQERQRKRALLRVEPPEEPLTGTDR